MDSGMMGNGFYRYVSGLLWLGIVLLQPAAVSFASADANLQHTTANLVSEIESGHLGLGTSHSTAAAGSSAPATRTGATAPLDSDDRAAKDVDRDIDTVLDDEAATVDGFVNGFVAEEASEYLPANVIEVMGKEIFGNTVWQFSCSFLLLLLTLLLRNIIIKVIFSYVARLVKRTRFEFDNKLLEAMHKPLAVFLLLFGIFVSLMVLSMSDGMRHFIENLYRGLVVLIIVWSLLRAVDVLVDMMIEGNAERYKSMQGFVPLIRKTLKIFIGLVGIVMVIDNLGFNVGGILATLGIGGAALAFASKDTVANGFGTLMIMLDRPFKVGDWITVGDKVDGDVEEIGLRSTKVRTWPKTVLSIPNGVLANEYINNWSRMPKRRVRQVINIAHGATANDMQALVEDIRSILKGDEGVEQEFMLVNFTDITAESLEVLVYYFTISIKWLEHMDVRQRVNLKMMKAVEDRGLKIAFLEQSVELDYGKSMEKTDKAPWDERWDQEAQTNPQGTYTRKNGRTGSNPPAGQNDKPQLPGDFGPKTPL